LTSQFPPQEPEFSGQQPWTGGQPSGPVPPLPPPSSATPSPPQAPSRGKSPWRIPIAFIAAFALIAAGFAIGEVSSQSTKKELTVERSQLKSTRTRLSITHDDLIAERSKVQQAQADARQANANAAAKYKADEVKLASKEKALARTRHGLLALEGRIQASSISDDGVYVIGADIKPGIWHTSGGSQCYFATLSSTNTFDIQDNNNFNGPETVDVSGAHAFEISGGCTWVRTG
jgi:hypothetical protein